MEFTTIIVEQIETDVFSMANTIPSIHFNVFMSFYVADQTQKKKLFGSFHVDAYIIAYKRNHTQFLSRFVFHTNSQNYQLKILITNQQF